MILKTILKKILKFNNSIEFLSRALSRASLSRNDRKSLNLPSTSPLPPRRRQRSQCPSRRLIIRRLGGSEGQPDWRPFTNDVNRGVVLTKGGCVDLLLTRGRSPKIVADVIYPCRPSSSCAMKCLRTARVRPSMTEMVPSMEPVATEPSGRRATP